MMISTDGKPVTYCPKCGEKYASHKWEMVTLAPDFVKFSTTGGVFLQPKCPPRLKVVK